MSEYGLKDSIENPKVALLEAKRDLLIHELAGIKVREIFINAELRVVTQELVLESSHDVL